MKRHPIHVSDTNPTSWGEQTHETIFPDHPLIAKPVHYDENYSRQPGETCTVMNIIGSFTVSHLSLSLPTPISIYLFIYPSLTLYQSLHPSPPLSIYVQYSIHFLYLFFLYFTDWLDSCCYSLPTFSLIPQKGCPLDRRSLHIVTENHGHDYNRRLRWF